MNQWKFTIKVSDILHNWTSDTFLCDHFFSDKLPWLQKEWMYWEIVLQHLNKSEILLTLKNLSAEFFGCCDRCWKDFIEKRVIKNISIQAKVMEKPSITEDLLQINPKDLTVDGEDFLIDQFLLHEPIKKLCEQCKKKPLLNNEEDEESESDTERF